MIDLIPEGCVQLVAAFDQFKSTLWNGHGPLADLAGKISLDGLPAQVVAAHRAAMDKVTDAELAELVRPFADGSLEALVQPPGSEAIFNIPAEHWTSAFFPERLFLAPEIGSGHGDAWSRLMGRTPFLRRAQFDDWLARYVARRRESRAGSGRVEHVLRQCLIGLVMDGALQPDDAEEFARHWGLGPLASKPDPRRHDPVTHASWSLAMAAAWIAWRGIDAVRDAWSPYRAEFWHWIAYTRRLPLDGGKEWWIAEGAELRTLEPMTLALLGLQEALESAQMPGERSKIMSVKSAREDLWRRLTDGQLVASGIDASGAIVRIPAHEWPYLELASDRNGDDYLIQRSIGLEPRYRSLTLLGANVLALWPKVRQPAGQPAKDQAPLFDVGKPDWSLLEAATWVGCEGRHLPSEVVAAQDLEDRGAETLFRALYRHPGLAATGLTQKRIRETIPSAYWEMATTDPARYRDRHYVSFIDDVLEEYGGQFTPCGEDEPKWFGIQIKRDALFAAYPEFAPREHSPGDDAPIVMPRPPLRRADKREDTRRAVRELYAGGLDRLPVKERLAKVNSWLRENGASKISESTLRRAINAEFGKGQMRQ